MPGATGIIDSSRPNPVHNYSKKPPDRYPNCGDSGKLMARGIAMPIQFQVGKLPDKTIIETFEALEAAFGQDHFSYQAAEVNFNDGVSALKQKKTPTYILTECNIRVMGGRFNVRIWRDSGKPNSVYFDEIAITPRGSPLPTPAELIELENVIRSKIKMPSLKVPANSETAVSGLLEVEMQTIASMHDKLLADALELRKTYDEQDLERRSAHEGEVRAREQTIQEQEKASLDRIAKERAALDERLKEFDFSDHMRARRKLREDITLQVREFLQRPIGTRTSAQKLAVIVVLCLIGAVGTGALALESFLSFQSVAQRVENETLAEQDKRINELAQQVQQREAKTPASRQTEQMVSTSDPGRQAEDRTAYMLWMLAIRGALLSAASVGFVIYLIAFIRKSHDSDVSSQQELQRYGMDINRASWVIETAMEMTTKEGATLPETWIEGACRGLFAPPDHMPGEVSPLAALSVLMGLAPNVSVGKDGANIEFSGKSAKKMAE
jgi:hypothetical protein